MAVAIVAGAIANKPRSGGEAWVRLSWALGLRRLGFDVWLGERLAGGDGEALAWFEEVTGGFGLGGRAALLGAGGERLAGAEPAELREAAAGAAVLFDLSGNLGPDALPGVRRRVYVDLDPVFTQAWHADPSLPFAVGGYDAHVTVGLNVGADGGAPGGGIEWIPTPPPLVLEEWPAAPLPAGPPRFTSVATWRSPHGAVCVGEREAPLKHHEFRRLAALPAEVEGAAFELALDVHPGDAADAEALRAGGWALVPPREAAGTPAAFRDYVRGSGAELSAAQGAYVAARSGWLSDRTAAYLASGRPAVVQSTGAERTVPAGEGLLTFSTPAEAAAGARRIVADHEGHAQAARALAEAHFDSDRVLARVLEAVGA